MVKGTALYITIVVALIIGVFCAALLSAAYFYKIQFQKNDRFSKLDDNLQSGINLLLASSEKSFNDGNVIDLFNNAGDSVYLKKMTWGIYNLGIVKSFIQADTLQRVFLFANVVDSGKWAALYVSDNDVPLSLSGKTLVKGVAYLPKAGVIQAYVDNQSYSGDKNLITGTRKVSQKKIPLPDSAAIEQLIASLSNNNAKDSVIKVDTLKQSFLNPARIFNFAKTKTELKNIVINGNIILRSDNSIYIDSTVALNNIIVFAKYIAVAKGFKGNCQLFATDSISVGRNCDFKYPSCLGILGEKKGSGRQLKIDSGTTFSGVILTWEKTNGGTPPIIEIGKHITLAGQIYSVGSVKFVDSCHIEGSLFTNDLLYKKTYTLFRGYLINANINSSSLSPYYLSSPILPVVSKKKKILRWLEAN